MPTVKVQWGPVTCTECETCICSTRVSYKIDGSSGAYITPQPGNPTQNLYYDLILVSGSVYRVKLTFIGPRCKEKFVEILVTVPEASYCCPSGYTLSPDGTYCFKQESVAATPPSGTLGTLVKKNGAAYSTCGSYIYNIGFNIDGTGLSTKIPIITDIPSGNPSTLWTNGVGNCVDATTSQGPLNRTGVWADTTMNNQVVGFGLCRTLTESKIYYIGIASDNRGIIKVNGVTIVNQVEGPLNTQYSSGGATFKVWHIYPITLNAGPNVINISGQNDTSSASIGCELYNATADQLRACTNLDMLTPYILFSTQSLVGQPVQIGTGGVGYTCPTGYDSCDDPTVCTRVVRTDRIVC